jgi:hypothetical protein
MKKIFVFLLLALPSLMLQSCLKDQEDVFDESASARMANYLKNANDVLKGAANGWVLDYYPDREQSYGGYVYTLKFDGQNVEVLSELTGEIETSTCLYKLVADDGPVLTFDTYNLELHYFATPWGSSGGYEAYDGDFEFVIMEATPQKVTLKGKRSGNTMYMYPLQRPAQEYIADVVNLVTDLPIVGAKGKIGTSDVVMDITLKDEDHHVDIELPDTAFSSPYVFYDKGIRFYQPIEIGGKSIYQLEYSNDAVTLTCTDEGATDVVLAGILSPATVIKTTGNTIAFDDNAGSKSYTINKLEQFTFTPDADWIKVTTSGNTLTINVDENATGEMRSGNILIEVGGLKGSITVSQAEFEKDILGDYTMTYDYVGSDGATVNSVADATLYQNESGMYMYVNLGWWEFTTPITYDDKTMTFLWESGVIIGDYKGRYYVAPLFLDAEENYWTSHRTGYFAELTITHDENGTHGMWHGIFDDDPTVPVTIWLYAYTSEEISSSTAAGYLEQMHNVTMQKKTNK